MLVPAAWIPLDSKREELKKCVLGVCRCVCELTSGSELSATREVTGGHLCQPTQHPYAYNTLSLCVTDTEYNNPGIICESGLKFNVPPSPPSSYS